MYITWSIAPIVAKKLPRLLGGPAAKRGRNVVYGKGSYAPHKKMKLIRNNGTKNIIKITVISVQ